MTDDQIDEIVKSKNFFQTELIDDHDGDHNHDDINEDDDIRHDFPRFGQKLLFQFVSFGPSVWTTILKINSRFPRQHCYNCWLEKKSKSTKK